MRIESIIFGMSSVYCTFWNAVKEDEFILIYKMKEDKIKKYRFLKS